MTAEAEAAVFSTGLQVLSPDAQACISQGENRFTELKIPVGKI